MDPDFRMPDFKTYDMNLPVVTTPSSVSSLGSGGMDPFTTAAIVKGGLDFLGGMFAAKRRRKEEELNRREREEAMRLARAQFGLEKQRYADDNARRRALAGFARENRGKIERGEVFAPVEIPKQKSYKDYQDEDYVRPTARSMFTGGS
jgi:hypothetical protein